MSISKIGGNVPDFDGDARKSRAEDLDATRKPHPQSAPTPKESTEAKPPDTREGKDYHERIEQQCESYRRRIENRFNSKFRNQAQASELASDVFSNIYLHAVRNPEKEINDFERFLNRAVTNKINDVIKQKLTVDRVNLVPLEEKASQAVLNRGDRGDAAKGIEESLNTREKVELAFQGAKPVLKQIFYLLMEGKKKTEISRELGLSPWLVNKGINELKDLLKPYFPHEKRRQK